MHKFRFRLGLRPRPLAGFKGPTSDGKEGRAREWEREGTKGIRGIGERGVDIARPDL